MAHLEHTKRGPVIITLRLNILEHTKDGKKIVYLNTQRRYNWFTILAILLLTIDPLLGHTKKGTIGNTLGGHS